MNKRNRTKKRKQAFYIHELGRKQQQEYIQKLAEFTLYISRKLEKEGKVKPVSSCDGSFETFYTLDDAEKILEKVSEKTLSNPNIFQARVHREFTRTKFAKPSLKATVLMILVCLLSFTKGGQAKWYEFSSPPGELSAYDTLSGAMIATAFFAPGVGPALSGYLLTSGVLTRGAGSAQRSYNDYSGKYPLTTTDKYSERLGVIIPGSDVLCRQGIWSVDTFYSYMTGQEGSYESQRNAPTLGDNLSQYVSSGIHGMTKKAGKNVSFENIHGYVEPVVSKGQYVLEKAINYAPSAVLSSEVSKRIANTELAKSVSGYVDSKVNAATEIIKRNPKAAGAAAVAGTVGTAAALDATGASKAITNKIMGTSTKGEQGNEGNEGNEGNQEKATG